MWLRHLIPIYENRIIKPGKIVLWEITKGWIWSKCIIHTYENITMKPFCTINTC
jgi:hypothetical protein